METIIFYSLIALFACLWLELIAWILNERLPALVAAPAMVVVCFFLYSFFVDSLLRGNPVDPLLVVGLAFTYAYSVLCVLVYEILRFLVRATIKSCG